MGCWLVSRCLLGVPCRYDGQSKGNAAVQAFLAQTGETVLDVCPECDCGLPCPRAAMRVREVSGQVLLTDTEGGEHAEAMRAWLAEQLPKWRTLELVGAVLKTRSPSCGLGDVLIEGRELPGDGLWAAALREAFPQMRLLSEKDIPGGAEDVTAEKLLKRVTACVKGLLETSPACHDWDHTLRVKENALRLSAMMREREPEVPVDELVVETAALMHDIGRLRELRDEGRTDHAVYGAALAAQWLTALGVQDCEFIQKVTDCIKAHRFRQRTGGMAPQTAEARIVYDADKLDSIGAIGIGRAFHFAGRTGARVHNRAAEALAGVSYSHEDSAYREYLVKLRHLQGRMLTSAGRELAESRSRFMAQFFSELNAECGIDDQLTIDN